MFSYNFLFGSCGWPTNVSKKKIEQYRNSIEFYNNFMNLYNMALDIFEWIDLPETCNSRFLEQSLLTRGQAILTKEPNDHYLNLGSSPGGKWNIYGEPVESHGYGLNGFHKLYNLYIDGADISTDVIRNTSGMLTYSYDAVLCRDNEAVYPYINYIMIAAERLTNAMRATDTVVQNLKQPVIVTCEESMLNSVRQALNDREANVSAIISSGKLPLDSFKIWDTHANPDTLKVMWEHYERVDCQVHEFFGIDSAAQTDKRERLLVDEVNANENIVSHNLDKRLKEREKFCERVNKAFGLNISVKLRNTPNLSTEEGDDSDVDGFGLSSTEDI